MSYWTFTQTVNDWRGTRRTTFLGDSFQRVVWLGQSGSWRTDDRHYVYANGEPVAIYNRTENGANAWRYIVKDHLGSVASITDEAGQVLVNESFGAFGKPRNPTTWSGFPAGNDEFALIGLADEGFTFQSRIASDLVHMGGRALDTVTGRFLSPDSFLFDPGETQAFNRYSYVGNNPLTYSDPSGYQADPACSYCSWGDDILASAVGAAVQPVFRSPIDVHVLGYGGVDFDQRIACERWACAEH